MATFQINENPTDLNGKVAIVTGGSSGIGKGAVDRFAEFGAKVVVADVNPPQDALREGTTFQKCDVTKWDEIKQLFEKTRELHGKIDIVCANAGINDPENLLKNDDLEPNWAVLDINLKGVLMTIKAAAYHFRKNTPEGGVVILTGSITSYVPAHPGVYVYPATKYALLGLLRTMRQSFPDFGSRINFIAPYLTATGPRGMKRTKRENYPDQPVNDPLEIAKAITTLAADETLNGKAVICIGKNYYETEEMYDKLLAQIASTEVVDGWNRVLQINPFAHMSEKKE